VDLIYLGQNSNMWRTRLCVAGSLKDIRNSLISRATNSLQISPTGVKSLCLLLGLDSNSLCEKCQSVSSNGPYSLCVSLLFNGYHGSLQGVKRQGCEFVHSPPSSAEVKNAYGRTSPPPIRLYSSDRVQLYLFTSYPWLFEYSMSISCGPIPSLDASSSKLQFLIRNIFIHAVSNTGYERRINVWQRITNSKHCSRKQSLPNLRYLPRIYLDGLSKIMKNIRMVSVPVDIRTGNLRNTSHKSDRLKCLDCYVRNYWTCSAAVNI
jgi:hypothetical protein